LRKPGIDGLRFRRQVPIGPYIVDFFCPQHRLIVEVDGGQHVSDAVRDRERDAWLTAQGYRVVRVWNNDVMENVEGVCAAIAAAAHEAAPLTPSRSGRMRFANQLYGLALEAVDGRDKPGHDGNAWCPPAPILNRPLNRRN
jgi:very-short-patch-repair endonuclease